MKILNFSCKEILPSLLDKTKVSMIRPAWDREYEDSAVGVRLANTDGKVIKEYKHKKKPPEHKVGDQVKLMWKKESKYEWFDIYDGIGITDKSAKTVIPSRHYFNKLLGTAEITEVFIVELHYKPCKLGKLCVINLKDSLFSDRGKIAKLDGRKDTVEMFKVLDKMYNLSSPKKFFVYRWKWSETN